MSLKPKHLRENHITSQENILKITKTTPLKQCCLLGSFAIAAIALLSSCQQPQIAPTPTPTATATPSPPPQASEGILEKVKARGKLICGVNGKLPGFSYVDEKGVWSGLDVDYCRAIAAAVLGDAKAVDFKPLLAKDRFTAVQTGEVDILIRNTTRTLSRELSPNIAFAPTTFFDGQGIMLRIGKAPTSKSTASPTPTTSPNPSATPSTEDKAKADDQNVTNTSAYASANASSNNTELSLKDLDNKKICVEIGGNASNLESAIAEASLKVDSLVLPDLDAVLNAYSQGDCEAVSSEKSQLAAWRSRLPRPADHKILDLSLSKEPLSPAILANDDRWRDVVTWVIYATFYAEELDINIDNYTIFKDTKNPEVARFLGTTDSLGIELGLAPDWTTQILKQVGNYSDIYKRNLAPLDIPRGLNRTWKQGGLLYSMPFR